MSEKVARLIRDAAAELAERGFETPRLDAEVLLRHVLGFDRTRFFARMQEPVTEEEAFAFRRLVARRAAGEPVAYLIGEREFMGRPFAVGPGVLVPRPETELLVEWALGWLASRPGSTVVDIGTGSGAIAVSVAAGLAPRRRDTIVGSDIAVEALAYAARNAAAHAPGRVQLVRGDLATWCGDRRVDLLLANLPYLTPGQLAGNPDLDAEPALALVAGADGLDAIRRLVADLPRLLHEGGAAVFELDPAQAETVAALIAAGSSGAGILIGRDLAGLPRFVVAQTGVPAHPWASGGRDAGRDVDGG